MNAPLPAECLLCHAPLGAVLVAIHQPDRFEQAAGISADQYLREWRDCPACGAVCDMHRSPEAAKLDRWMTNYYEVEEAVETMSAKPERCSRR